MDQTILSSKDLDFLLFDWLDAESLTELPRFAGHDRDSFRAVLDLAQQLAEREFRPHNRANDTHEPSFDGEKVTLIPEVAKALAAFAESGLLAANKGEEHGGIDLPNLVHQACFAWFQAANIATSGYPMLTMANANLILAHGSEYQRKTYAEPLLNGRFYGTMCLSEPHAGSSLTDLTTVAKPVDGEPGTYRLHGTKMWISGGEHELGENIVHLVLARTPGAPAGTKGLSLFVVPKYLVAADGSHGERNDVSLVGLNHKMGFRGITNTMLNFGEGTYPPGGAPGALGTIIGEEGRGLAYMFHMMNAARIGVGAGAAALGYTGYLESLAYARERLQGRPVAAKDPAAPQVPIAAHADVRRMLLAQKSYVEGALGLVLYAAKLLDESENHPDEQTRQQRALLLDVLTPVVKSWPSQWCLEANNLAIQVLGGAGYTRDWNVEQFYRDNRLNPIHEGTHGIHGQDLLGRKVIMGGGAGWSVFAETVRSVLDDVPPRLSDHATALRARLDRLEAVTATLWSSGDPERALAHASTYLEAFGHIVIAWIWLSQATAALACGEDAFTAGKLAACDYFFTCELPRVGPQLDLLEANPTLLLDLDPDTL